METKHIQAQVYFCFKTITTLQELHALAAKESDGVYEEAIRLELEPTGPMEFIYFDFTGPDTAFTLYIAIPVKEMKPLEGDRYSYHEADSFICKSHIYPGDINHIGPVYTELFSELYKNGIKPSNQIREVYTKFIDMVSPENITEIQIGIE